MDIVYQGCGLRIHRTLNKLCGVDSKQISLWSNATEQPLGADSPISGFFGQLRRRAAQVPRSRLRLQAPRGKSKFDRAPEYVSMQEPELEESVSPTAHPPWWKRLLLGALLGGFFGALEIWFYEFSLNRLMAAILSGASFFGIIGLLAVKFAKDRSKDIALGGFAGFVAGIAYWLVAQPPLSLILAVAIGLVTGIVYVWGESKD